MRDPKLSYLDVKVKNQQVIPQANVEFHEILDDIEDDIVSYPNDRLSYVATKRSQK